MGDCPDGCPTCAEVRGNIPSNPADDSHRESEAQRSVRRSRFEMSRIVVGDAQRQWTVVCLGVETSSRPFISSECDRERTILSPRTHVTRYRAESERSVVCLELHVAGYVLDAHRTVVRAEPQIRSTRRPDNEIHIPCHIIVPIPWTFGLDCR